MTPWRATYRLQLNRDFTFAHAKALVPYLVELGISHVYLSPILKARPGSTHGYDTVDHTRINPELGGIEGFRDLVKVLRQAELGVLLDFVPNHMGVGGADNALWLDLLKHGKASRYADWFDVDWQPPRKALTDKLLVPFLGTSYAEALLDGQLRLDADEAGFAIWANADKLPIRPEDEAELRVRFGSTAAAIAALAGRKGDAESWIELDALISTQHWRLSHFAAAADEINYRRFFINSDLAGIRIERPDVFEHVHKLLFSLIDEGLVDGLRIDHIDGLRDPKAYLVTLRAQCPRPIYLVVEKILAPHERLRADWPVDGTTGYEFGAQLTRLLTPAAAEPELTETYSRLVGSGPDFETETYRAKLHIMDNEMAAELFTLARHAALLAWSAPKTSDLTEAGLRRALREVIAHLAVYRTHGNGHRDRRELCRALAKARRHALYLQPASFDFVERLLLGETGHDTSWFTGRFQQYCGPVMAKGLEDTALYRYNRLVALNEVGAHPDRFSLGIDAFHDANARRLAEHPQNLFATTTHDTKRGEDTRALIGAVADHPTLWASAVDEWRTLLAPKGIHPNDLYLLFQLLLGGWPILGSEGDFSARLKGAMMKALREARERSDWGVNNAAYETKIEAFIDDVLAHAGFRKSFETIWQALAATGRRKALIQAALKLTVPGVPDIYRGAEDWEQSFVDPDNRRPLDFAALAQRLASPDAPAREKLHLTQALLHLRKAEPALFAAGSYEPIDLGPHIFAFRRRHGAAELLVMADLSPGHTAYLQRPPGEWIDVLTAKPAAETYDGPVFILVSCSTIADNDGAARQHPVTD